MMRFLTLRLARTGQKSKQEGVIRLRLGEHRTVPVTAVSDDEYYALPRKEYSCDIVLSVPPEKLVAGQYYCTDEAARMVVEYLENKARRCDCGRLRQYTLQRCYECHTKYMVNYHPTLRESK